MESKSAGTAVDWDCGSGGAEVRVMFNYSMCNFHDVVSVLGSSQPSQLRVMLRILQAP